jgi:hypothetical protein
MKHTAIILFLLLSQSMPALAAGEVQSSRSAGKLKLDQDTDLSLLLEQSEPLSSAKTAESEKAPKLPSRKIMRLQQRRKSLQV